MTGKEPPIMRGTHHVLKDCYLSVREVSIWGNENTASQPPNLIPEKRMNGFKIFEAPQTILLEK